LLIESKPFRRPPRELSDWMGLLGVIALFAFAVGFVIFMWFASSASVPATEPEPESGAIDDASIPLEVADSEPGLVQKVRQVVKPVMDLPSVISDPIEFVPDWPTDRPVGILLLGTDRREGDPFAKTDTIMALRIDPKSNSAIVVSVPRDVCVDRCNTEPYRINTVLFLEGPDALRLKVSDLLGVALDYHVIMDFQGFVELVDFFGGVEINVQKEIRDFSYPNAMDDGFEPFILPEGLQTFDGDKALRYVRSRHQVGDFGRIERQQKFLLALRNQVLSPKLILQAPALIGQLRDAFDTNLPITDVPSLAKLAQSVPKSSIKSGNIDYTDNRVFPVEGENGAQVLYPNIGLIRDYVKTLVADAAGSSGEVVRASETDGEHQARQQIEP